MRYLILRSDKTLTEFYSESTITEGENVWRCPYESTSAVDLRVTGRSVCLHPPVRDDNESNNFKYKDI